MEIVETPNLKTLNQNIKAERDMVNSEDNNSIDETSKKEI